MFAGRRNLLQHLKHDGESGCEDMLDLVVSRKREINERV